MFNHLYNILKNVLIFLCLLASIGAIVYRLYSLNIIGVLVSLVLTITSFIYIKQKCEESYSKVTLQRQQKISLNSWQEATYLLSYVFYLIATLHCFYILFRNQTSAGIISPWEVLPNSFFLVYALATLFLILNIIQKKKYALILIIIHYFLSFAVVLIVYKIGYGFDPFIHRATLELISAKGSVEPKPFYYLGQYALIIILHKIFFISIETLDKLLVPLLASIYLPIFLFRLLKQWFQDEIHVNFVLLALLVLPYSFFTITTPQSFAYLLLILTIILGLNCKNMTDIFLMSLLTFTALTIQPIAGIPALFLTILVTIFHSDNQKLKKYFYIVFSIFASLAIPTALIVSGKISGNDKIFNWKALRDIFNFSTFRNPGSENVILNATYLFIFNYKFLLIALILFGTYEAWKHREDCKIFIIYLLTAISFYLSYFLTKLLNFDSLIDYERTNYSDRILVIAIFFLLPFILTAIYAIINKIFTNNRTSKGIFVIFFVAMISTSLFANYPRIDNYHNSHGYSVSEFDIEAVRFIEETKTSDDYIVLANQQISAAALNEFGFAKYYQDNIFYYPIPTGGPLYQYYLDMVYHGASKKHMKAAMKLAGVNEAYFVINKYWWAFPKILDEAKTSADSWRMFGKGDVFVFKYTK